MEEGQKLQGISRSANDPVKLRRAIVVLMSAQGQTVKDITMLMQVGEDYVCDVIHAFNDRGFDALNPKWNGGRAKTISDEARERLPDRPDVPRRLEDHRLLHLEPEQARRTPHQAEGDHGHQPGDPAPDPAGRQGLLENHHHLEGVQRPGVHREDAPRPDAVRQPSRQRTGDMRRRVRTAEPDAAQG